MKCKKCGKEAKYKCETIFRNEWYFCGMHIKKFRNNPFAIVTYLPRKEDNNLE